MSKATRYTPKSRPAFTYVEGTLLYLFLVPLFLATLLALFNTQIKMFILSGLSFFLFLAVANLARKGFLQESTYHHETFTKAPKVPFKMISAYLLAASTLFTAHVAGGQDLVKSIFLAIVAFVGYYLFYGFDPKVNKFENLGDISSEFVLETLKEAKAKLQHIQTDMERIEDLALYEKLNIAVSKGENILQVIEDDPKDVRVARKFLTVYLDGVAKVTDSYTALKEEDIAPDIKEKLHTLMDDVELRFNKELTRLQQNNEFDLDVHIDVLSQQIKY
jgi:5-bromo-4-chloroindolyl phosphate hydrolysis protein